MSALLAENRLTRHIAEVEARIAERLTDPADLERFTREMDVTPEEHFRFQQAQAEAHAAGDLSTEEAQIVYVALGEVGSSKNGGWAAGTSLATKVSVTVLMGQLLQRQIKRRKR